MIRSMLASVSEWINESLGTSGITIIIVILAIMSCLMFANVAKAMIGKTKPFNKWVVLKILFLAVCVGLIIWLCTTY